MRSTVVTLLAGFFVIVGGACAPAQPEGAAPPQQTSAPVATGTGEVVMVKEVKEVPAIVGAWSSPGCGTRRYERRIEFFADGTFQAQDRVSPCPPKVVCIWSGIVFASGTYGVEENTIFLRVTQAGQGAGAFPLPERMAIDPATGGPMEVTGEGLRCAYVPFREGGR